jgi:hypothetical protein
MSDFVGLYMVVERVDRNRLNIERFAANASSGGWLLEVNQMDPISPDGELPKNFHTAGPDGVLETPADQSLLSGRGDDLPDSGRSYFNFSSPSGNEVNVVQRQVIEDWMTQMEDVLYGHADVAWNDPIDGYWKYIDVDSFVDYFILQNIPRNNEGLRASFWLYNPDPNGEGKLTFGPIWDNDGAGTFTGNPSTGLMNNADRMWYERLFGDPDFMQRYIDRWQRLRDGPLSSANMEQILDGLYAQIGYQAAINDRVSDWPDRQQVMKNWVVERASAIDQTFVTRPDFSTHNGEVPAGFSLSISSERAAIYYTTDGSDPRLHGGTVSPSAAVFDEPLEITQDTIVKARSFDKNQWSGVIEGHFTVQDRGAKTFEPGDTNRDGQFDRVDLFQVLQAGKFQTGQPANWSAGDWNGDGVFDQVDIVASLQTGKYLRRQNNARGPAGASVDAR